MIRHLIVIAGFSLISADALADRVHLVGGSVLEGKVTPLPDKVVIDVESGTLTLPLAAVERIERSASDVAEFETMLGKVKDRDIKGLLQVANFCRERRVTSREHDVLRKVLEIDPNHSEARDRLGYVRTAAGWVSRDEARRAQGLVEYKGQWVTREQLLELTRLETATRTAQIERQKAELELEAQRVALEAKKAEAERQARMAELAEQEAARRAEAATYAPYLVVPGAPCTAQLCPPLSPPSYTGSLPAFGIPGVRDPRDMSFTIPGARDPRSYF